MKPRVIAYVADNSTLNGWLVQLASLSENYNCIAVSSRDKILDYLHNKPLSLLVMQLDRQDSFLTPVLDFLQSTMSDLPIIGFVVNDEKPLSEYQHDLNFSFLGKIASAHQMQAEIKRAFLKFSDGGELQSISPSVLLQQFESQKKTCTVRLFDPDRLQSGVLFFVEGGLCDARLFKSRGLPSACEIFTWNKPKIWIENRCSLTTKAIRATHKTILLKAFLQKETADLTDDGPHCGANAAVPRSEQAGDGPSTQSSPLPATADATPCQPAATRCAVRRVADALSLDRRHHFEADDIHTQPALSSLVKRFSLAGSIIGAGSLKCGFIISEDGPNDFFVCLDQTVGVRNRDACRREPILQSLFQLK